MNTTLGRKGITLFFMKFFVLSKKKPEDPHHQFDRVSIYRRIKKKNVKRDLLKNAICVFARTTVCPIKMFTVCSGFNGRLLTV